MSKFNYLLEKVDDRLNPIVVKELRQSVRAWVITALVMLFLLVQLFVVAGCLIQEQNRYRYQESFYMGREIFELLMGVLTFTGIIGLPIYAGVRLATERSGNHVDLLFISTLSPFRVVSGKFFATLMLAFLIYAACMPFLCFTYLLRGIDLPSICLSMLLGFAMIALAIQASIFVSSLPGSRITIVLMGLATLGGLVMLWVGTIAMNEELIRRGIRGRHFWLAFSTAAFFILAALGLLFFGSVALVTSPSANRSLPVRVYLSLVWIVSAALVFYFLSVFPGDDPLEMWCILAPMTCGVGMLMAISERDKLGMRMLNQVPRNFLARRLAFFFYSGAAGGMTFFAGLGLLSLLVSLWAGELFPRYHYERELMAGLGFMLSTFAYALIALWIRRIFLARKIPSHHSWAFALLLIALGSVLPLVLLGMMLGLSTNSIVLWLGFPFAGFDYRPNDAMLLFLFWWSAWLLVAALLNARWYLRQWREFRAPERQKTQPKGEVA